MKHIQGVDRKQRVLFPKAIDDYIPARGQECLPVGRHGRRAGADRPACRQTGVQKSIADFGY